MSETGIHIGLDEVTSFEERALLVKSLQQVLKHFSARLAYMRRKSCILLANEVPHNRQRKWTYLLLLNNFGHVCLFGGVEVRKIHDYREGGARK